MITASPFGCWRVSRHGTKGRALCTHKRILKRFKRVLFVYLCTYQQRYIKARTLKKKRFIFNLKIGDKVMEKSSIIEKVKELDAKGQTFVRFENVCLFLRLCNVLGVLTFGGAFADDMSGQWFYK